MGLTVNRTTAAARFAEALRIARSKAAVPKEWVHWTECMHDAKSATFTPMLGTALLAKATDDRIDTFALQEGASHKSYSARGLATEVLVPQSVLNGIDLRTRGAEPLNNSPFFREERVGTHLKVHQRARKDLDDLLKALTAADFLNAKQATKALAAFVRTRERLGEAPHVVDPGAGVLGVSALATATARLLAGKTEGGRRGQAVTASCLDLVFSDVQSGAINDPGARVPGDVLVGDGSGGFVLSAEAKQKVVSEATVLQFVSRVARAGIGRAIYAAFAASQPALDVDEIEQTALGRHGVIANVVTQPEDLLLATLLWTSVPIHQALAEFPRLVAQRLVDFGCVTATGDEWATLVAAP